VQLHREAFFVEPDTIVAVMVTVVVTPRHHRAARPEERPPSPAPMQVTLASQIFFIENSLGD
jgi:hypothetical protein